MISVAAGVLLAVPGTMPLAWAHGNEPPVPQSPASGQESIKAPGEGSEAQSGLNPLALLIVGGGALAASGVTLLLIGNRTKDVEPQGKKEG